MDIWNGSQMLGDFNPNKILPTKIWRLLLNLETLYLLLLCKLSVESFRPHKVNLFQRLETTSLFGFQDPKCVPKNQFLSCVLQLLFIEGCVYVCYLIVARSEPLLKLDPFSQPIRIWEHSAFCQLIIYSSQTLAIHKIACVPCTIHLNIGTNDDEGRAKRSLSHGTDAAL